MSHHLSPHRSYKDSGVPWLGEVPAHWYLERAKWLFRKMHRQVCPSDEVITCFRDGVVTLRRNRRTTGFTESLKEIGYQGVRRGDLIIHAMDAFAGAIGVSDSDGKCSPVYTVCLPKLDLSTHYYAHVVREMSRTHYILMLARGIRERSTDFRFETLSDQLLPVPPLQEQAAIARFLDHIDRRIRRYIRAKQRLIKLLEEQKQAIIHQAVTRGVDPNVRLTPSGVEWLGEVPEHWEVRKLKFEMAFSGGGTPSKDNPSYWDGDIPWVSPKDMKADQICDTEDHITEQAIQESSTRLVSAGSVLMVVRSGILQRAIPIAICGRAVAINQDMKALTSRGHLLHEYFVLMVRGCEKALLTAWTKQGATVESIEHQYLANTAVPVPPVSEQQGVICFVAQATTGITDSINVTQREISLIREYRTRLIADVVTGKLDVREAAAGLPDEVDEPEDLHLVDEVESLVDEVAEDANLEAAQEEVMV